MNNFKPNWESDFDKQFNSTKRVIIGAWIFSALMTLSVVGTGIYLLLKHFG
jgi:hypothetical protein